jgi:hypothetical protein
VLETTQEVVTTTEPLREKTEELKWEGTQPRRGRLGGAEVGRGCGCREKGSACSLAACQWILER